MIDPNIFRAYDIRGVYGETLTEELMEKIGVEIAQNFPEKKFIIGNDVRASGESLANSLKKGLESAGNEATYVGTSAFGAALHAGTKNEGGMTLYLTASHLPPEWNGLKMYYHDGEGVSSEFIYGLRDKIIEKNKEKSAVSNDANENYIQSLKQKFKISKPLKIVVDCGNGSTCLTAPKLFKELGFETIILHGEVDSQFSARSADIKPNELNVLKEKVLSENADFGVAFDGDGDRIIIFDEKGNVHRSDKIGLALAKNMISNSDKKNIVVAISVSMAAETDLKPLGANIIRVPVGHTFVISKCKEENALVGMEESGHLVLPDYFLFDDAVIPALKVGEILSQTGKKCSELMNEISSYPYDEIVFKCDDATKFQVLDKITKGFSQKYEKINTMDGVRVDFDYGWVLIRCSNTSPKVRLYLEATDMEKFKKLVEEFVPVLEKEGLEKIGGKFI